MHSLPTFCVNAMLFQLGQSPVQFQVRGYGLYSNLRGLGGFKVCGLLHSLTNAKVWSNIVLLWEQIAPLYVVIIHGSAWVKCKTIQQSSFLVLVCAL